jgi:hypothetical protein
MSDLLDERRHFRRCDADDGLNHYLFGEFVHHHEDMFVATRGGSEGSYLVQSPYSEWPRWRNCPQGLSWDVLLLGEELTPFALPD